MRLRKKIWRTPGTIYLDTQLIDNAGSEMFVEPLDRPEPMKRPTQMQVYVRFSFSSASIEDYLSV